MFPFARADALEHFICAVAAEIACRGKCDRAALADFSKNWDDLAKRSWPYSRIVYRMAKAMAERAAKSADEMP